MRYSNNIFIASVVSGVLLMSACGGSSSSGSEEVVTVQVTDFNAFVDELVLIDSTDDKVAADPKDINTVMWDIDVGETAFSAIIPQ